MRLKKKKKDKYKKLEIKNKKVIAPCLFNKAVSLFWHSCRDEADVRHVDGTVLKIMTSIIVDMKFEVLFQSRFLTSHENPLGEKD